MKIIRIESGGHADSTKIFVDGRETTGLHVTRILLEGNHLNRAWLEVCRPEIDVVAELDEGPPPADRMLSLERKIDGALEEISERLAAIEESIRP